MASSTIQNAKDQAYSGDPDLPGYRHPVVNWLQPRQSQSDVHFPAPAAAPDFPDAPADPSPKSHIPVTVLPDRHTGPNDDKPDHAIAARHFSPRHDHKEWSRG